LLGNGDSIVIPPGVWRDTILHLPEDARGRAARDTTLASILATFPVGLVVLD
jgi:hypothetical protein